MLYLLLLIVALIESKKTADLLNAPARAAPADADQSGIASFTSVPTSPLVNSNSRASCGSSHCLLKSGAKAYKFTHHAQSDSLLTMATINQNDLPGAIEAVGCNEFHCYISTDTTVFTTRPGAGPDAGTFGLIETNLGKKATKISCGTAFCFFQTVDHIYYLGPVRPGDEDLTFEVATLGDGGGYLPPDINGTGTGSKFRTQAQTGDATLMAYGGDIIYSPNVTEFSAHHIQSKFQISQTSGYTFEEGEGEGNFFVVAAAAGDYDDFACGGAQCLFKKGNKVFGLGHNKWGQLGFGDTVNRKIPTELSTITNLNKLTCGKFNCMFAAGSNYYASGRNQNGQLGLGDTVDRSSPVMASLSNPIISIDCGFDGCMIIDGTEVLVNGYFGGPASGTTGSFSLVTNDNVDDVGCKGDICVVALEPNTAVIDGKWSSWVTGPCSVTCGKGTKIKSRTCTEPAPQNGGSDCSGASLLVKKCKLQKC
eukprot:NODE_1149_length_1633_cov_462.223772_g1081_i0.p1 GENE.NODE_1149_length_1633_cov_462.223772_g1081_i0~~NODE_1149_length_1633_cov_462.223772_g1081_i0.p1  ORF type:complete len:498 (+),score=61.81 NODE_1149_length_1633_cov_462.223772_g1081_i0:56-1495(+)